MTLREFLMPVGMVSFHKIQALALPPQFLVFANAYLDAVPRHINYLERKGTAMQYWYMALVLVTFIQAGLQTCAPNEAPETVEPAVNLKEKTKTSPLQYKMRPQLQQVTSFYW